MIFTRILILTLAAALTASAAPLIIVFDNFTLTGAPGDTLSFSGVLANSGADPFFLNSPEVSGLDPGFAPDLTPFFITAPLSIDPGGVLTGIGFFDVVIPPTQPAGDYLGQFTIVGGADDAAQDMFSTAQFTVSVTSPAAGAPEPGTEFLVGGFLFALWRGGRIVPRGSPRTRSKPGVTLRYPYSPR